MRVIRMEATRIGFRMNQGMDAHLFEAGADSR